MADVLLLRRRVEDERSDRYGIEGALAHAQTLALTGQLTDACGRLAEAFAASPSHPTLAGMLWQIGALGLVAARFNGDEVSAEDAREAARQLVRGGWLQAELLADPRLAEGATGPSGNEDKTRPQGAG